MDLTSNETFLGRALRLPLALIPEGTVVRIVRGPLRGKKWLVGSGTHGCWLGSYERKRLVAFASELRLGRVVYDIGANVGIYSLLAGAIVGGAGQVYAFEPSDRNLVYLRRHLALNCLSNCEVVPAAVSESDGWSKFDSVSWESSMGRLSERGDRLVRTLSLDGLVHSAKDFRLPDVMKIDVEGAELGVLKGCRGLLSECSPVIFLETHGPELHSGCCRFLAEQGYLVDDGPNEVVARRR